MDDFLEQVARRKRQGVFTLLYVMIWMCVILFGLVALMNLMSIIGMNENGGIAFNFINLIIAAVFGGAAYLMWRRSDYCRMEYDYTFTNGILDVSQVLNNKRRRYLTALDMKDVIRCGPTQGPGFQKTLNEQGLKKHNWFLNRDANLYYFYFTKKGVKHLAVLELQEEMIAMVRSKKYLQPGAWVDADGKSAYNYGVS